jgi:hypothetical protein
MKERVAIMGENLNVSSLGLAIGVQSNKWFYRSAYPSDGCSLAFKAVS